MYNVKICECFWRLLVAFPLTVTYYLFLVSMCFFCTNKDLYYYYYYNYEYIVQLQYTKQHTHLFTQQNAHI